jgi:hypothetical protein
MNQPARILETRTGAWARTAAVDFFRGLGLLAVYLDHMAPNILSHLTLWRFGFSDFAEIFVYLSGFIGIGSYQRALDAGDTVAVLKKLARRVGRLYVAHVLSLGISMIVLWAFAQHRIRIDDPGLYAWMQDPARYALRVLTLTYAPVVFSLLPLYMAMAPILLLAAIGLRRAPHLTFSLSAALWLASQIPAIDARLTIPEWFLHPAAWQFLFVLGAGTRFYSDRLRQFALSRWVVGAAAAIVAVSAVLRCLALIHRIVPLLPDLQGIPGTNVGKPHLAFYRLLHFLALAVVVHAWTSRHRLSVQGWFGRLVTACGTDSLFIYCSILVLDIGANLFLAVTHGGGLMQVQLSVFGLALLCGMAWLRQGTHVPTRAAFPALDRSNGRLTAPSGRLTGQRSSRSIDTGPWGILFASRLPPALRWLYCYRPRRRPIARRARPTATPI